MTFHFALGPRAILTGLAALLPLACGKPDAPAANAPAAKTAGATVGKTAHSAKVEPFTYAAPVTGHYAEINTGDFDLVDGLAYRTSSGDGTVVYVTSKPIGSPVLAESDCPMSEARVIALLRNAPYLEVTLDSAGKSKFFHSGTQLSGRSREEDVGGGYWTIDSKKSAAGHASGSVAYRDRGSFTFDLPVVKPVLAEVSECERMQGRRTGPGATTPSTSAVVELYRALHKAAKAKDLAAMLAAQGFDERHSASIRGMSGIDADFAAFADLFLDPGEPGEASIEGGYIGLRASGSNAKGEKFSNYYEFATCGERLLLVGISMDRR